jgi:hypothetical protein
MIQQILAVLIFGGAVLFSLFKLGSLVWASGKPGKGKCGSDKGSCNCG